MRKVLLLAVSSISLVQSDLVVRQNAPSQEYLDSVCSPSVNGTTDVTIPPCISIKSIQQQCRPNGTQPLDYVAHAECLCNSPSTFFSDWLGCRDCILVHGGMTQRGHDTYAHILSAASSALCSGTPTAKFEDIFATLEPKASPVVTGSTVFSDQFPSSTAVSLYYTTSGVQGPGAITGRSMIEWLMRTMAHKIFRKRNRRHGKHCIDLDE
jgi:hypothetical protein